MRFMELDNLIADYQAMHDRTALGGRAVAEDDGEGRVGLYNPDTGQWDWWGWAFTGMGYEKTGSTLMLH
jgi:hypothetical protein